MSNRFNISLESAEDKEVIEATATNTAAVMNEAPGIDKTVKGVPDETIDQLEPRKTGGEKTDPAISVVVVPKTTSDQAVQADQPVKIEGVVTESDKTDIEAAVATNVADVMNEAKGIDKKGTGKPDETLDQKTSGGRFDPTISFSTPAKADPAISEPNKANEDKAIAHPEAPEPIGVVTEDASTGEPASPDTTVNTNTPEAQAATEEATATPGPSEDIEQLTKADAAANPDSAVSGSVSTIGDSAVDAESSIAGASTGTDSGAEHLMVIEQAAVAFENELIEIAKALDTTDALAALGAVTADIETPTENELKLIAIVDKFAAVGNDAEPGDIVPATETFSEFTKSLNETVSSARKAIGDSIATVYKGFGGFISKINFILRTYRGQLAKLKSIVADVRRRSSRESITTEVSEDPMLWVSAGKDHKPVMDGKQLSQQFVSDAEKIDKLCIAYAVALMQYKDTYEKSFEVLLTEEATDADFVNQVKTFGQTFIDTINKTADLKDRDVQSGAIVNKGEAGLGGQYFFTQSPVLGNIGADDKAAALKAAEAFSVSAESPDIKSSNARREITISISQIEKMLVALADTIDNYEKMSYDKIHSAVEGIQEAVAKHSPLFGKGSNPAISDALRIQVGIADTILNGYFVITFSIRHAIDFANRLIYEVLSSRKWYEQDLGSGL